MSIHKIANNGIDFHLITKIIAEEIQLELSAEAKERIRKCRTYLDERMAMQKEPIYGINTGFGALYNKTISASDLETLQQNLVMSHACGTGERVPDKIVKLMLFLKIQGLSYGNSGVQVVTVQRLIDFYNHNVLPVVYQQGSLGASGDLAPLAHLSLPLLGLGSVVYNGTLTDAATVHQKLGWNPIRLKSKEGLALLNGTQFMSAYGSWAVAEASRLSVWADVIAAISLDAYDGRIEPFHSLIQEIRPHSGQIETAGRMRKLFEGSELIRQEKKHVQDPYSFRCIPQVHGASKDAIGYVKHTFLKEINSVTDNPTIFPEEDLIISAGNFHGQPLALALDFMAIALSELGNISERRTYQLISGQRELPPFLVSEAGLNSGFMIPQYTAASLVSQNKQLCTPASVDSIVSSNGQEDHVSMGANGVVKTMTVLENVERILAIELMNSAQALEFRRPMRSSGILEDLYSKYRKVVPFIEEDKVLYPMIEKSIQFIQNLDLSDYGTS